MKLTYLYSFVLLLQIEAFAGIIIHDESEDGEFNFGILSPDYTQLTSPTHIGPLSNGENTVIGVTNSNDNNQAEAEFFSFTVPKGLMLTKFVVDYIGYAFDTNGLERFQFHFISFDDSNVMSFENPGNTSLFATLIEAAEVETANGEGSEWNTFTQYQTGGFYGEGFTAPLAAGTYSVFFQETSATPIEYEFTFTAESVPEPSTLTLLLGSGCCLLARRKRL